MSDKIAEGNRLIAEFMGVKRQSVLYGSTRTRLEVPGVGAWFEDRGLQYHTSWDWLMPVVEKIESIGTIIEIWMSLGRGCRIVKPGQSLSITNTNSNSTIEAVWQAVVEFIQWYNNQTITNE